MFALAANGENRIIGRRGRAKNVDRSKVPVDEGGNGLSSPGVCTSG